jgi:hypothetical protein
MQRERGSVPDLDSVASSIESRHVHIQRDVSLSVASLRYFEAEGTLDHALASTVGAKRPPATRAATAPEADAGPADILAWRRPGELLYLTSSPIRFSRVRTAVGSTARSWFIDQSSGYWIIRVGGSRVADLYSRLGGQGALPGLGESCAARLADVPVLSIKVRKADSVMVVDRLYGPHLMQWMRETVEDFAEAPSGMISTDL